MITPIIYTQPARVWIQGQVRTFSPQGKAFLSSGKLCQILKAATSVMAIGLQHTAETRSEKICQNNPAVIIQ